MRSRDLPGLRTEKFSAPAGSSVQAFDDHEVYDTPDNRQSWWGHRLVLDDPPEALEPWVDRWKEAHTGKGVGRAMFAWEGRKRVVPELPEGAEHERIWTLMCDQFLDPVGGPAEVRPATADDREALVAYAMATEEHGHIMAPSIEGWLARSSEGGGHLWTSWIDGQLVGVVGLFHDRREARTQWIATHPDHRRKGICTQLLITAVVAYQEREGGIVYICADEDSVAEKLYRDLGWRRVTALDCVSVPV